jgi:hypothetical protein
LEARIESSIDKAIKGEARERVKRAMRGLPKYIQDHINPKFRYVQVAPTASGLTAMGNKEGFDKVATLLLPLSGTTNQYATPSGRKFSAPAFSQPRRPHRERKTETVVIDDNPGSGEYRRVMTPDGYVVANPAGFNRADAVLGLTCNDSASFAAGDGGYVYFESRSDYNPSTTTTGWPIEAGLQYQAGTQTFAPYLRLYQDPLGHRNGFVYFQDATITSSNPSRASWSCFNDPNPITRLYMTYSIDVAFDTSNNPENSFYLNTQDNNDGNNYLSIQYILPAQYYPWKGYDDPCNGCVMMRVTSIAQPSDKFTDGSIFGPVSWRNANVYTASGRTEIPWPTLSECNDYPGWTTDNFNECYSGPPSGAAYNNIVVNYTDTSNETVSITDR